MLNYRYPEQCCGKCTKSYQSDYGDYQCREVSGSIIDIGGVCDYYEEDTAALLMQHLEERQPVEQLPDTASNNCSTCKYSFDNNTMCIQKGKAITDIHSHCRQWEGVSNGPVSIEDNNDTIDTESMDLSLDYVDQDNTTQDDSTKSCVSCVHSYVDSSNSLPHCDINDSVIHNTNEYCEQYVEEIDVEQPYIDCEHCKHSYLNQLNSPMCALKMEPIDDIEGSCEEAVL
jgi:hypothetical protein